VAELTATAVMPGAGSKRSATSVGLIDRRNVNTRGDASYSSTDEKGEMPGYSGDPTALAESRTQDVDVNEGCDDPTAGEPYTDRRRTDAVKRALCKYTDRQLGEGQNDWSPNPCFEMFVRDKIRSGEEDFLPSAKDFADRIRASDLYPHEFELHDLDDRKLAAFCVGDSSICNGCWDAYWSWCDNMLMQNSCTWHCRKCRSCQDWREWHCKTCNQCVYGVSFPCQTCRPLDFAKRMLNC